MELDDTLALEMDSQTETTLLIDTDVHSPLANTDINQEPGFHTGDGAKLSENSKYAFDVDVVDIKTEIIDTDFYQNPDTRYTDGMCSNSNYVDTCISHDPHVTHVKPEPTNESLETTNETEFIIEIDTCKDEYYEKRGYPINNDTVNVKECAVEQVSSGHCATPYHVHMDHTYTIRERCALNSSVDIKSCSVVLSDIRYTYPDIVTRAFVQVQECGVGFTQTSSLKMLATIHTGEKPHKCDICEVSFTLKGGLTRHMRTHTGEKPYQCSICEVSFMWKDQLTRHMRIHTGEKPYKCALCGVGFADPSGLKYHTAVHTGATPHKCSFCDVRFRQKGDLTRHARTHTGEKPHKCSVCGAEFAQKHHMTEHTRIHTGEKPYRCSVCEGTYTHRNSLTRHMLLHTGEKPHKCSVCGVGFRQKRDVNIHMRMHN